MADEDKNPNEVTMSAQEAATLRKTYELMGKLYEDPEKGMDFKKMLKGAGWKVPELDTIERVTKPYDDKLDAMNKTLTELSDNYKNDKKKAAEDKEESDLKKLLDKVRKDYDLDDDGMKKVIDRMKDMKSGDAEGAAAFLKLQEPKPKLTTSSNFGNTKFKGASLVDGRDETWDKITKDPDSYFEDVVNDVINSPENSREFGGKF